MTETLEANNLADALKMIDSELGRLLEREMVTANEVSDLLLDLRVLLAASAEAPKPEPVALA